MSAERGPGQKKVHEHHHESHDDDGIGIPATTPCPSTRNPPSNLMIGVPPVMMRAMPR
jgi:hypothetical protein